MSPAVGLAAALAASYLVGSIPTAYLLVKWLTGADVRTLGSGNVGATNAARAAGGRVGVLVFAIDVAKGLLVVQGIALWLVPSLTPAARLDCGVLAVIGHAFPVWLKFRGGKGVATTIGVLWGALPAAAAVCVAVWVAVFALTRYVSVASLAAAAALPLAQLAAGADTAEAVLGLSLSLLIMLRHADNLRRLRAGTEPRVRFGRRR